MQGPGEELRGQLKRSLLNVLVLDQAAQTAVRDARRPSGELLDRLSAQIDLSLLTPYETSKPVTGSRFFGREFEIRRILQGADSNFAIMGIRRIGKTSLMREIERQLKEQAQERGDEDAGQRIIFMDCSAISSPAHFMQEVVRKLRPQELTRLSSKQFPIYFPDFLGRMAQRYGGPLVFFLDEFDKVLTWHDEDDSLLNALRASSNQGQSRYVVGGFREVMRAFSNLDSPLYNFARPVRLKEFSREQTAAMVLGPLEKLGVRFERPNDVVDRIFDETAGQPNLIQFYCSILVERLGRHEAAHDLARQPVRRVRQRGLPGVRPQHLHGQHHAPGEGHGLRPDHRRAERAAVRRAGDRQAAGAARAGGPALGPGSRLPQPGAGRHLHLARAALPFRHADVPAHAAGELRRGLSVPQDPGGRDLSDHGFQRGLPGASCLMSATPPSSGRASTMRRRRRP